MLSERPAYAEIDLAAIRHNVLQIKSRLKPEVKFCAVVKADGYGHGALAVSREALAAGADYLAVAILDEAIELRAAGITAPILIFGFTPLKLSHAVADYNLTQMVYTLEQAQALSQAAAQEGRTAKIHIKIETGLNRLGIQPEEAGEFAAALNILPKLEIEGIFTHFATADSQDKTYALKQLAAFKKALKLVEERGLVIPIRHCANSAATLTMPETHMDMVRIGIFLYGLYPSSECDQTADLKPAMQVRAKVAFVKEVPKGTAISYGCAYVTPAPSKIATLTLGYADGLTRMFANKRQVVINGQRAPLAGRVCMDQCMIDVTGVGEVKIGDEALLFGGPELPADEVAEILGTNSYEVVCMVNKRLPRRYVNVYERGRDKA